MATRRSAQVEVEVEDGVEDLIPRTGAPDVAPELDEGPGHQPRVSGLRPAALEVEIEVERVYDEPVQVDPNGMVEIRMARTIDEFTYGNPHNSYRLEAGKRYRLPLYVAQYLDDLEALHHRS